MISILQQFTAYIRILLDAIRILLDAIMEQHKDGINFRETLGPILCLQKQYCPVPRQCHDI